MFCENFQPDWDCLEGFSGGRGEIFCGVNFLGRILREFPVDKLFTGGRGISKATEEGISRMILKTTRN